MLGLTAAPCTYGGSLTGATSLVHLSEAPQAKRVVLVPKVTPGGYPPSSNGSGNADTVVRVHETDFLDFVAQYEIPKLALQNGATAFAHGRFVFATATMDKIFVVVQADPSSGASPGYAVATLVP